MSGIEWAALAFAAVAVVAFFAVLFRGIAMLKDGCPRCSGRGTFCSCVERCEVPACKARKAAR